MRRQEDLCRARRLLKGRCPTHGIGLPGHDLIPTRARDCTLFLVGCPRRDCTFVGLCADLFGPAIEILPPTKAAKFTLEDLVEGGCVNEMAVARLLASAKAKRGQKTRATFYLPVDLVEQARDAVVALRGPPVRLTLAALAENALRTEILRLKQEHNKGRPFPKRGEVWGRRPLGS